MLVSTTVSRVELPPPSKPNETVAGVGSSANQSTAAVLTPAQFSIADSQDAESIIQVAPSTCHYTFNTAMNMGYNLIRQARGSALGCV